MLTNKSNLPAGLVRAIENDPYDSAGADITASTLNNPPLLEALKRVHPDAIEEDAADRVWALLGQAAHVIAERGAEKLEGTVLSETRYAIDILGWKVSGAMDHYDVAKGILADYKVTSAWTLVYGDRIEDWTRQLNVLAHLIEANTEYKIGGLEVIAILRDWAKRDVERVKGYPSQAVQVVALKLWPKAKRELYIAERVALHQKARELAEAGREAEIEPCSDDERWMKRDKKTGAKTFVRCVGYCPVKNVCPVLAAEAGEAPAALANW